MGLVWKVHSTIILMNSFSLLNLCHW